MPRASVLSTAFRALFDPRARSAWRWCWALLCAVVAIAALTPADSAPTMTPSDKIDHFLAFAALAGAGALSMPDRLRSLLIVATTMLAFGAGIEWGQTFVPGRFGDMADVLADGVGVLLGLGAVWLLRRRLAA